MPPAISRGAAAAAVQLPLEKSRGAIAVAALGIRSNAPASRAFPGRGKERRRRAAIIVTLGASVFGCALLLSRHGEASRETPFEGAHRVVTDGVPEDRPSGRPSVGPEDARMTVTGRVLDAEGHPVSGVSVRMESEARPGSKWSVHTALDGSFVAYGVDVGKVRLQAGDDFAGEVESAFLEPSEVHGIVLVLGPTQAISGVVLDERGAPVARARVTWFGRGSRKARIGTTDEQGRYAMLRALDDADRLAVWADGFDGTTVVLEQPGRWFVRSRDVRLHRATPLRGVVLNPAGDAVVGARVSACEGEDVETTTSDEVGAFELPAVTVGCWVTARHARFANAVPRRIAGVRFLTVRLGAGGAIDGTVVDARHRPVGAFSVSIASVERDEGVEGLGSRAGETTTFLHGDFRIDNLAPGAYVLRASAEGKAYADSTPIKVSQGKVIRGEQYVLADADEPSESANDDGTEAEVKGGAPTDGLAAAPSRD